MIGIKKEIEIKETTEKKSDEPFTIKFVINPQKENNNGVKNMQSKKANKIKECKKKTNELNNKGFREAKDISGKSPIHKAAALKTKFEKEQISKEVAITPVDNELGKKEDEENITQEATSTNLKVDDVEIPDKDDESILMPDTREIIAETQKVGKKQNVKTWLAHPNLTRREYYNIIGAKNDVLHYIG